MKSWAILFRVIIAIIGIVLVSLGIQLYNLYEDQRMDLNTLSNQQKVDAQVTSNRFKDQQQQVYYLSKDLHDAQQQIKDQNDAILAQKDALLQEVEKRQQIENASKNIQTSLVGIMAETDAIKEDMKGWQKDYVSVLAVLEKKMDESQYEIKSLENNLVALNIPGLKRDINSLKTDIEKMTNPPDNSTSQTPPVPDNKIDHTEFESQ